MNDSRSRTGWIGSLILHFLLLLIFWLINVPKLDPPLEYIEIAWGGTIRSNQQVEVASPAIHMPDASDKLVSASPASSAAKSPVQTSSQRSPVELPERRTINYDGDILPVPKVDRTAPQMGGASPGLLSRPAAEGTEGRIRSDLRDMPRESQTGQGIPAGGDIPGLGTTTAGSSQGYHLEWDDRGTRKPLRVVLPSYPPNVTVGTQIQVRAFVLPNGSVRAVAPLRKGDPALEQAAIVAVRMWEFESLPVSLDQIEQAAIITFVFRLR